MHTRKTQSAFSVSLYSLSEGNDTAVVRNFAKVRPLGHNPSHLVKGYPGPSHTTWGWEGAQGVTSSKPLPKKKPFTPERLLTGHPVHPRPKPTLWRRFQSLLRKLLQRSPKHSVWTWTELLIVLRWWPPHPSLTFYIFKSLLSFGELLKSSMYHVAPWSLTNNGVISPNFSQWEDLGSFRLSLTWTLLSIRCFTKMW